MTDDVRLLSRQRSGKTKSARKSGRKTKEDDLALAASVITKCNFCGKPGHQEEDCWFKNRRTDWVQKGGRGNPKNNNKEIVCWSCGEKGHISPNCPNKKKPAMASDSEESINGLFIGHLTEQTELYCGNCDDDEQTDDIEHYDMEEMADAVPDYVMSASQGELFKQVIL